MEVTIDEALRRGIHAQNEGRFQEAERIYRSILQSSPKHGDANHNLGVLAVHFENKYLCTILFLWYQSSTLWNNIWRIICIVFFISLLLFIWYKSSILVISFDNTYDCHIFFLCYRSSMLWNNIRRRIYLVFPFFGSAGGRVEGICFFVITILLVFLLPCVGESFVAYFGLALSTSPSHDPNALPSQLMYRLDWSSLCLLVLSALVHMEQHHDSNR